MPDIFPDLANTTWSAILGALGTILWYRYTNARTKIKYSIRKTELFRVSSTSIQVFKVTAPSRIVSSLDAPAEQEEIIHQASVFLIPIKNFSYKTSKGIQLIVQFEDAAKIIGYDITPPPSKLRQTTVAFVDNAANKISVDLPFLNSGERIQLSVITTKNSSNHCEISGEGEGVSVSEYNSIYDFIKLLAYTGFGALLIALFTSSVSHTLLPDYIIQILGGEVAIPTEPRVNWPLITKLGVAIAAIALMAYGVMRTIGRSLDADIKNPWNN